MPKPKYIVILTGLCFFFFFFFLWGWGGWGGGVGKAVLRTFTRSFSVNGLAGVEF